MDEHHIEDIKQLFKLTFNEEIEKFEMLPVSGSSRIYYRLKNKNRSLLATYNNNLKENTAFLHISEVLSQNYIPVPAIFAHDLAKHIYLQEDLGDETVFNRILKLRQTNDFPDELIVIYKQVIENLVKIQINAGKQIDYTLCYPRSAFDRQSIMWDLNYFKYQFLKYTDVDFDEQLLENDFNTLCEFLLQANENFFLFRDFQSRNIMLHNNKVYFIDYQGGRKGGLQYDVASLLFDSKAEIPIDVRTELYEHYIKIAKQFPEFNEESFRLHYPGFVLIRLLQAFGAYGYRGLFEKKQLFIDSIFLGLKSLNSFIPNFTLLKEMPELSRVLSLLPNSKKLLSAAQSHKLTVTIKSFSFKRGIPYDETGNGGGHVFDCRFINNPGKDPELMGLTGKQEKIIKFLENEKEAGEFFESVKKIVSASIRNYASRGFKNLSVNFGCTGGLHRSVFFAEKMYKYISENFDINIKIIHTEI